MKKFETKHQLIPGNLKRTFVVAAVFHILFTAFIYFLGSAEAVPGMLNPQGVGEFASDGDRYLQEITSLVEILRSSGVIAFVQASGKFHTKLYAISFALLHQTVGFTILGAELVNLAAYLGILGLVYTLGREIFHPKVGLFSVWIVGLWPSFLLYTTQLYKTPLFIVVFLALVLSAVQFLSSGQNIKRIAIHCMVGLFAIVVLWLIRNEWWMLFTGMLLLLILCLVAQIVIERRLLVWKMIAAILLLLAALGIQKYAPDIIYSAYSGEIRFSTEYRVEERNLGVFAKLSPSVTISFPNEFSLIPLPNISWGENHAIGWLDVLLEKLLKKIDAFAFQLGQQRYGFASINTAGSNIEEEYDIRNAKDLLRFLPRAFTIGLFSPFPNMWFSGGAKLGLSARLLSGLETLFMYGIYGLSIAGLWRTRRELRAWYLVAVSLMGMLALGLVITNIGALYRFRYSFWMIIIVFGVGGYKVVAYPFIRNVLQRFSRSQSECIP
jgi:hypothetical protein